MAPAGNLSRGLKAILSAVLLQEQTHTQLNHLIGVAHTLARVFIRTKVTETLRHARFQSLDYSDIAYDCIGDLFQQDGKGNLVQLEAYFRGIDFSNASEEDLLSNLRRLVFSKVNQNIFRIYNESDPSLGRIIRNIKLAIQSLGNFELVTRFDESCMAPPGCDAQEHLPVFERDELEVKLRETARGTETIPQLLAQLSLALRQQTERSRLVPLVSVALVFRSLYQNQLDAPVQTTHIDDGFLSADARAIIRQTCERLKNETKAKYVGKNKVPASHFEYYFEVIEEHIAAKTTSDNGVDFSFYKGLKSHMPELTEECYYKQHKQKIEYLGRLAYEKAITLLKRHS